MSEQSEHVLTPDAARRSLRSVWALLLLSLPVYGLVALVAAPPADWDWTLHTNWAVVAVFAAMAVATMVAIPLVRKHMFFRPLQQGDIDRRSRDYLAELRTMSAATWALATSLAIYGLLAYFFSYSLWVFAAFFGPSIALFLYYRPPYDLVDEMERPR